MRVDQLKCLQSESQVLNLSPVRLFGREVKIKEEIGDPVWIMHHTTLDFYRIKLEKYGKLSRFVCLNPKNQTNKQGRRRS